MREHPGTSEDHRVLPKALRALATLMSAGLEGPETLDTPEPGADSEPSSQGGGTLPAPGLRPSQCLFRHQAIIPADGQAPSSHPP